MAQLTKQTITRDGLNPTYAACEAGGDLFANSGVEFVAIKNAHTAPINVTFVTQTVVDGLAVPDRVVAVPNGVTMFVGPFSGPTYNNADGNVAITYAAVTNLTIAVLKKQGD